MKTRVSILLVVLVSIINLSSTPTKQPTPQEIEKKEITNVVDKPSTIVQYNVVSEDDLSFVEDNRKVKRTRCKVLIDRSSNEQELKTISEEIIENLKSKEYQNAVTILYYLPNTNTEGIYTAGMVDWVPYGDWCKANKVWATDYSKHEYKIIVGGFIGKIVEPTNTTISKMKREEIFYNLVKLQDTGYDSKKTYKKIAKQYEVDVKLVKDIAMEGLTKNWLTPKNLPTPKKTVNKPPTSKEYPQVADVIEERLSWDGDYTISRIWELKETTDWYHGKCWTQTIVYSMNGITNKCLFFIKKDLSGWTIEGWEIIE